MKHLKKALVLALALILVSTGVLAAEKVIIGASTTPHAVILEFIKDDLLALGYELEIQEIDSYFVPNPATAAGDLDANYFQHLPFLNLYNVNVSEKDILIPAIGVHYEQYGIYAGTKSKLDELAEGDHIAVTNDPSNETRALLLLQEAGFIKLDASVTPDSEATKEDIIENPKNIIIDELNAELIPLALPDVAFAVINGNYAIGAGLSPAEDALLLEDKEGNSVKAYTNYVVVRAEDENAEFVKALRKVLYTQETFDFIVDTFGKDGVVPVFEIPAQ